MKMTPSLEKTLTQLLGQSLVELRLSTPKSFSIHLEIPKNSLHGDLTSNCALWLGRQQRRPPLEIAQAVVQQLQKLLIGNPHRDAIKTIEVVPPGFINFFLTEHLYQSLLSQILLDPEYGSSRIGEGIPVQVEFVSANPTGPLSVAHGRQAAIGDSLCRILAFCGHPTTREYYVNDVGHQIELLGQSLQVRVRQLLGESAEIPEGGYQGEYLVSIANDFLKAFGERYRKSDEGDPFKTFAVQEILKMIREDLEDFEVHFDAWTYESEIRQKGPSKRSWPNSNNGTFCIRRKVPPGFAPRPSGMRRTGWSSNRMGPSPIWPLILRITGKNSVAGLNVSSISGVRTITDIFRG